jgi:hypothetical protein
MYVYCVYPAMPEKQKQKNKKQKQNQKTKKLSWSEKSRYKRLLIVFNGGISGTRKAISQ